jgi:hypothetical protein
VIRFPNGETVIVHTRVQGADDPYGQPTWTWTDTDVDGVAFDPGSSSEGEQPWRQEMETRPNLLDPSGVLGQVASATSRVTVRGEVYEADGEPRQFVQPWVNFTGTQLFLRRVEG